LLIETRKSRSLLFARFFANLRTLYSWIKMPANPALNAIQPSSSSLQWQIDIPSLSQLILNVGAYGLKQLALAGVDIHSIGCLLLISNSTPTRIEYRQELNKQRQLQRNERKWLFTMVEIGAASNFLADELLKTRAGENVLALLSALIPHLSEASFPRVLMQTFEHFGIPAESTPGMGQISKIRATLAPFVGRMEFKDRVLLSHKLFSGVSGSDLGPNISIPASEVIPNIISALYKVSISDQHQLHVFGIRGAAWIATYASHVLGLGTCAVLRDGEVLSLTASYTDSKVIFFLYSTTDQVKLYKEQTIEELISTKDPEIASNWLVSCDRVNFLQYHCPNMGTPMLESISHFVAATTFGSIRLFLAKVPIEKYLGNQFDHFDDFMSACMPQIQDRAIEIIKTLGFLPRSGDFYRELAMKEGGLTNSFSMEVIETSSSVSKRYGRLYFQPLFWVLLGMVDDVDLLPYSDSYVTSPQLGTMEYLVESLFKEFLHQACCHYIAESDSANEEIPSKLFRVVENAITFSATLAFTDWNTSNRSISSEFLGNRRISEPKQEEVLDGLFEGWQQDIMHAALTFSTTMTTATVGRKSWWADKWLGQNYDGIVVLRHLACSQDLFDLPGCLATFHPGHIIVNGEHFQDLHEELISPFWESKDHTTMEEADATSVTLLENEPKVRCMNWFQNLELRNVVTTNRDSVWIRMHVVIDGRSVLHVSPSRIANNVTKLLVSHACPRNSSVAIAKGSRFDWKEGLFLDLSGTAQTEPAAFAFVKVLLQQVNRNRLGQWLSVQARDPSATTSSVQVLQQNSCLSCIVEQQLGYLVVIIPNTESS
jgi:hypothetical protein